MIKIPTPEGGTHKAHLKKRRKGTNIFMGSSRIRGATIIGVDLRGKRKWGIIVSCEGGYDVWKLPLDKTAQKVSL